jgi:chemotaxis response regulator CheB
MTPIRILVVDDSLVIRRLLSDTLSEDRALEVVGTASDGRIALAKIPLLKPDLITLDIEMPVMGGLETLAAVRKLYPKLPVIIGLCHQAKQYGQSDGCNRTHSHRTYTQDQGAVWRRPLETPAASADPPGIEGSSAFQRAH